MRSLAIGHLLNVTKSEIKNVSKLLENTPVGAEVNKVDKVNPDAELASKPIINMHV